MSRIILSPMAGCCCLLTLLCWGPVYSNTEVSSAQHVSAFVELAIECAVQEYPNKISHTMQSDVDQGTPGSLHPAFYGCFDWHSSVHGHWLLARFARIYPEHPLSMLARSILAQHLTEANMAAEVQYILADGRTSWERPYGLAWLLQLAAELREWEQEGHEEAAVWARALRPLEEACTARLRSWLPKLAYPIRTGEHSQTAFAFGLVLDYSRIAGNIDLENLVMETSFRLYGSDFGSSLRFEPSGQDFLSPTLAEADLMRRMMQPEDFSLWLLEFMPELPSSTQTDWLPVAKVTDRTDGKLAHLDGLNLSRAWMLEGIASGLPRDDSRLQALKLAAEAHRQAGLEATDGLHYEGGHWLGTFAFYLISGRGIIR